MDNFCILIDGKVISEDEIYLIRKVRECKTLNGELFEHELDFILKWRGTENVEPMLLSRSEYKLLTALGCGDGVGRITNVFDKNSLLIVRNRDLEVSSRIVENIVAFCTSSYNREVRNALSEIMKEQEADYEAK